MTAIMTSNPDPYRVLEVDPGATDGLIRERYLSAVRAHPPDRDPAGFQRVRRAYEQIKDTRARLSYLLFESNRSTSLADLVAEAERTGRRRWNLEMLRRLFLQSSREGPQEDAPRAGKRE
jgi:curved DNA-binding protein CbpA